MWGFSWGYININTQGSCLAAWRVCTGNIRNKNNELRTTKFMERKEPIKMPQNEAAKRAATGTKKPKAEGKANPKPKAKPQSRVKASRVLKNKKSPIWAFTFRDAARMSGTRTKTLQDWILLGAIKRRKDGGFNITEILELKAKEGGGKNLKSGATKSLKAQKSYEDYWATKAETMALNLQVQKGELINLEDVTEALIEREVILKNRLLGLPSLFASQLAGCEPGEIEQISRKAIADLLRDLVRQGSAAYNKARSKEAHQSAEAE